MTTALELTDDQIKHMVNRFLAWRLPENFNPDGGIKFETHYNTWKENPPKNEPIGTNLFSATQAEAMVRHMVEGLIAASEPVLDAEMKTQVSDLRAIAKYAKENGNFEYGEHLGKAADMIEHLATENARLIAERSAARERIEALKKPDLSPEWTAPSNALKSGGETYNAAINACLGILKYPAAPRADEGVVAKLDAATSEMLVMAEHAEYLKSQLDALTKGVAAAKEAIVAKMQTEKKPGVAQGLQFAVLKINEHLPPAATDGGV